MSSSLGKRRRADCPPPPRPAPSPPSSLSLASAFTSQSGATHESPATSPHPSSIFALPPPPPQPQSGPRRAAPKKSRKLLRASCTSSTFDTPAKRNSSCVCDDAYTDQTASNALRPEMDMLLYDELYGKVDFNVAELWNTFTGSPSMLQAAIDLNLYTGARWVYWPPNASEANVLTFLRQLLSTLAERARHVFPSNAIIYDAVASGDIILDDGDCERKTDLVFVGRRENGGPVSWKNVRAIGELKSNPTQSDTDNIVLQLANYAREVFGSQPNRRFVPAFTLCGSDMRVWHFDRAGACGSTVINIHTRPALFLAAITSFATMDATAVGFDRTIFYQVGDGPEVVFDPTVHWPGDVYPHIYIPSPSDNSNSPADTSSMSGTALSIDPDWVSRRIAIATRGSACWKARPRDGSSEWVYIVKDQWRSSGRDPEGRYLQLHSNSTPGLPQYLGHNDVFLPGSAEPVVDDIRGLRPDLPTKTTNPPPKSLPPGLTSKNLLAAGCQIDNRVHTRLVSGPVGRPLKQFGTYTNLLQALRDAIVGHRYMYETHQVLHRDISKNNILLNPVGGGGFLIDFDLAVFYPRTDTSGAAHRTGTFDFMALDVLLPYTMQAHNPMHDLESFFYLLLFMAIYYHKNGQRRDPPPEHTIFTPPAAYDPRPWLTAHGTKSSFTRPSSFRHAVLPTLAPEAQAALSGVLRKWRSAAFPPELDDDVDSGPPGPERIREAYDAVLQILDDGIAELGGV
ncbi:hypothetical protein FN846DRAFT_932902 [Sphaerosporella brunnea]|uniref:non-specific serine/threonine protein kinase n=1 Tax=Sphaerosporella brunnea TaxID=1250544 RepID=A0A5J5F764_9PEZI|nr:hypothetical protein FN846DRAFT_932902 [Sphaerosporella brunnea]